VIVVDTSALFAVVARERERETFINILDQTDGAQCSAVSYVEAVMALTGRSKTTAAQKVSALFEEFRIEIVAVDPILAEASVAAFDLYGKGRHRARLNLGDCFSYALAKTRDLPLLFKGDDFVHTDIVPAWRP
jgi:ribonuclease VapC